MSVSATALESQPAKINFTDCNQALRVERKKIKKKERAITLDQIFPNPNQPRRHFDQAALEELAQSIEENGLLEPIVITPRNGGYMIVGGERRWRACDMAGVEEPPVIVKELSDRQVAVLSMIENLQREDLNLIEEARGYQGLLDEGFTMDEVAQKLGFKQTWRIRERADLLRLQPMYQSFLVEKRITPSQAFEMSRLTHEKQDILYDKIKTGRADTYNKLRSLVNALLVPPPIQAVFGGELSAEEKTVGKKYDRLVDRLLSFVRQSVDREDLTVLAKVTESTASVNIQKIDLIIADLNKIKKAMVQAESRKEAIAA